LRSSKRWQYCSIFVAAPVFGPSQLCLDGTADRLAKTSRLRNWLIPALAARRQYRANSLAIIQQIVPKKRSNWGASPPEFLGHSDISNIESCQGKNETHFLERAGFCDAGGLALPLSALPVGWSGEPAARTGGSLTILSPYLTSDETTTRALLGACRLRRRVGQASSCQPDPHRVLIDISGFDDVS
jgi:hypothetical protein